MYKPMEKISLFCFYGTNLLNDIIMTSIIKTTSLNLPVGQSGFITNCNAYIQYNVYTIHFI